jgi:hypothetical protein
MPEVYNKRQSFMNRKYLFCVLLFTAGGALAQEHDHHEEHRPQRNIEPQPLMAQAIRLKDALSFLGSALSADDERKLDALQKQKLSAEIVKQIEQVLDPYCLFVVNINPEARVKVERGAAVPKLISDGWSNYLVKVENDAGVTALLRPESPNALSPVHVSSGSHTVLPQDVVSGGESQQRFLDLQVYNGRPMTAHLSGQKLEYAILEIYSKDAGSREAQIGFNVGQGTQDIGFRNTTNVLFDIKPSVAVRLNIKDEDGSPAMASLMITDSIARENGQLANVYPLPSRRVAALDAYPDFFFQKQVYRHDGETISLPPGKYVVTYTRGPEYVTQTKAIEVPAGKDSIDISFSLKRWINMAGLGWYSGDHHVHAAGCSHYDSPEEGVPPRDMWRQALGEDLNVSAVLSWGPSWYNQKKYFTGSDNPLSTDENIMRYDVEVSGFPSSHAGHIVLLRIKEDDYPGVTEVEQWPSWTLPILKWAKEQGGVVGYAHSGWGLEPINSTSNLPNYEVPRMDGIGANEYIVAVTQGLVDFYSAGDTPPLWELNMWYHTLNCGYRTRLSGETDFPCITDNRVGLARSYFQSGNKKVNYDDYVAALKAGRSYMTDGSVHLLKFAVNGTEVGTGNSEIKVSREADLNISASIAAYLPVKIGDTSDMDRFYYNPEKSRIGKSRNMKVELVVNGIVEDSSFLRADGKINNIRFKHKINKSSWVALRVPWSAHSNPIFVLVDDKPICERRSAEWCMKAVEQCWKMKEPNIRDSEKSAAKAAYDAALKIYSDLCR